MKKLIFFLLLVLPTLKCFSQTKEFKNEFGFKSDNDSFLAYGQDRYYTNGLFLTFRHALAIDSANRNLAKKTWEAGVGQFMYNAYSGRVINPKRIDRPFAAYLYAGAKLNWFYQNERALQASINIGTIGSSARGKEVQETLHDVVGFYEIRGWEYQVKDEIGINTSLEYTDLLKRSIGGKTDLSFNGVLKAGNTLAGTGVGLLFRAGSINPLFNSVSTNSRISNSGTKGALPAREFFFFAQPTLQYIAYDATIQGGLFTDSKGPVTFSPKRFVFSQELGVMYSKQRWTFDFSLIFKSREIKSNAKAHQYGSASIYYRFN